MNDRFLKWTATLGSVALLSGALVVTANAHIGASHSPVMTNGPDLVSAEAESDDTADFCFDEEVTDFTAAAGGFNLRGYNSDFLAFNELGDVDEDDEDENCVEVQFEGGSSEFDLREMTIALVEEGVVEDRAGDSNPEGSVALGGSIAKGGSGITAAPNLLEFEAGNDSITFTFDQNLACEFLVDPADAENFGYYDDSNDAIRLGDSIDECNEGEVEVGFDGGDDPEQDADRAFVAPDGCCNDDFLADPGFEGYTTGPGGLVCQAFTNVTFGACVFWDALGDEIDDRPDLTGASRSDEEEWLYEFDQDIDDAAITVDYFHLIEEDGRDWFPLGPCSEEDDSKVECGGWNDVDTSIEDAADSELPLAIVDHCAVEDDDADPVEGADCGTIGRIPLASSGIAPGFTDGPDLEIVNLDAADETAEFCFDEPISDDEAGDVEADEFFLVEIDGDTTASGAGDVDDIEGNCITIDFDEDDLNEAVGGGVEDGAVEDWLENDSPPATAGTAATSSSFGSTATATTTGGGGGTTTVTQDLTAITTTTTFPFSDDRVSTTLSIRYNRKTNTFKGRALSRVRRCRIGRHVTLKRHRPGKDRTIGRDTTNRSGEWRIRKRVRRGRFHAVVARKVFTNQAGGRTTCRRDWSVSV